MESNLPPIPNKLAKALSDKFPDQCARLEDENRMVWFKAGQRSVIDYLLDQHKIQNETILERKTL